MFTVKVSNFCGVKFNILLKGLLQALDANIHFPTIHCKGVAWFGFKPRIVTFQVYSEDWNFGHLQVPKERLKNLLWYQITAETVF